jgi:hypothetical protein
MRNEEILTHIGGYQARAVLLKIISDVEGKASTSQAPCYNTSGNGRSFCNLVGRVHRPTCCKRRAYLGCGKAEPQPRQRGWLLPSCFLELGYTPEFSYDGWAEWVIYVEKGVLVGAIFVGRERRGMLHASTVAVVSQVPVSRLRHAVAVFPMLREIYAVLLNASGD